MSESSHWLTRGEWVMASLTFIYVILTGFYAFVSRRQLREIEDQGKSNARNFADQLKVATEANEVARLNAEAVMNAERAWVMVDVKFRPASHLTKMTSGDGTIHTAAMVEVSIQNCGATPAWIFEQWIRLEVADFVVASATEYPTPEFPSFAENARPKVSKVNYSIIPSVKGQQPYMWAADLSDEGWATDDNGRYVHIFGVVRYRDAFSSLRETYFGYNVWRGELIRMPSDAYNKHT